MAAVVIGVVVDIAVLIIFVGVLALSVSVLKVVETFRRRSRNSSGADAHSRGGQAAMANIVKGEIAITLMESCREDALSARL